MACLILLNGPPGIGKTTIARRYVVEHPLALCLDVDSVRRQIGGWEDYLAESGLLARKIAIEMARVHLTENHDVVVPQLLARVEFLDQLESLASLTHARWIELVLMDDKASAIARFEARAADPGLAAHHREMEAISGGSSGLSDSYDSLLEALRGRPTARIISTKAGDADGAYRQVIQAISTDE